MTVDNGTRQASRTRLIIGLVLLAVLALTPFAPAHTAVLPSATVKVAAGGELSMSLRFDVLAYTLNDSLFRISDTAMLQLLDGPPAELQDQLIEARERLRADLRVVTDTGAMMPVERIDFPDAASVIRLGQAGGPIRLPVMAMATITGRLPPGTRTLTFRLPEVLGDVILVLEAPGAEPYAIPIAAGETSEPMPVSLAAAPATAPAMTTTQPVAAAPAAPPAVHANAFVRFAGYVRIGFEHILPEGLDHILFVLGLFLLSTNWRALLTQVTAFTVAHSLTLGLSMYGVVQLPSSIVEPVIAASIAFVAIENLFTSRLTWWRSFVVFAFGLIHGLGFAGAFRELDLPRADFLSALAGFNIGVELGQLTVIGLAFVAVGWVQRWPTTYRRAVVWPASIAIAVVALVWTVERIGPIG